MTPAQIAILNNKIASQLSAVGSDLMPTSKNNTESYAWAYLMASKGEKFFKTAKEKAVKEAIKAGVMFDHIEKPLEPGTKDHAVFSGEVVKITCDVKQPSEGFDHKTFLNDLMKCGRFSAHDMEFIHNLYGQNKKQSRPAHTFTAELVSA